MVRRRFEPAAVSRETRRAGAGDARPSGARHKLRSAAAHRAALLLTANGTAGAALARFDD